MTVHLTAADLAILNAGGSVELAGPATTTPPVTPPTPAKPLSVAVKGKNLIDQNGDILHLHGVSVSSLEATPIAGWSPKDPWGGRAPVLSALQSWGINALRIPLNEASVLNLTCYDFPIAPATVGAAREADPGGNVLTSLIAMVKGATAANMYVILDYHLGNPNGVVPGIPGTVPTTPNCQNQMADADHAIAFWTLIANTFKGLPNVIYELFNEPHIDNFAGASGYIDPAGWQILLKGGEASVFMAGTGPGTDLLNEMVTQNWKSAGTQAMLNAVRATGATNVVLSPGLSYNQYLNGWLTVVPKDPLNQLAASWHPYSSTADNTKPGFASSYTDALAILAAGYPLIATETGDYSDAARATWLPILIPFLDANNISALAWTWDAWDNPEDDLILDNTGTPTPGSGVLWKAYCLRHAAAPKVAA